MEERREEGEGKGTCCSFCPPNIPSVLLSWGLLVEFWWCLKCWSAQRCTFAVLWVMVWEHRRLNEKTPERGKKLEFWAGEGKQREMLGPTAGPLHRQTAPHLTNPTPDRKASTVCPSPKPLSLCITPSSENKHTKSSHGSQNRAKQGLQKLVPRIMTYGVRPALCGTRRRKFMFCAFSEKSLICFCVCFLCFICCVNSLREFFRFFLDVIPFGGAGRRCFCVLGGPGDLRNRFRPNPFWPSLFCRCSHTCSGQTALGQIVVAQSACASCGPANFVPAFGERH